MGSWSDRSVYRVLSGITFAVALAAGAVFVAPGRAETGVEEPGKALAMYSLPAPTRAGDPAESRKDSGAIRPPASTPTAYIAAAIASLVGDASSGSALGLDPDQGDLLDSFYIRRGFAPAWVDGTGLSARTAALFGVFRRAADDGLDPEDYIPLPVMGASGDSAGYLARLDVSLSASFLRYARHLRTGRSEPERLNADGAMARKAFDAASVLTAAAAAEDLGGYLSGLAPVNASYEGLRRALHEYRVRAAAGGWPAPAFDRLEPGSEGDGVVLLRTILRATGDLREDPAGVAAPAVYDDAVTQAVQRFQTRHGLEPDGIVGEQTRLAMAVPVEARIHQILLNMERARWLPDNLGDPHLMVNLAGFTLNYVGSDGDPLEMRVIVGKPDRSTPEFSGLITYLELNPTWTVPRIIALEDLLPQFRRDPNFAAAKGFTIFSYGGGAVDPAVVDWSSVRASGFPYWLRQKPGPGNALGRVKFMFPNTFDVYLHDTPSRGLFSRPVRAFSSGCIRLERPMDLALKLLEANGNWSRERLRAVLDAGETRAITLSRPIPVHLAYLTAWRGADGAVNFRDDIYGRDRALEAALSAQAVSVAQAGDGSAAPLR
ncbi:MAG: L,D-transpeptidase family protein [Rhodospirillales bacterium]|nr:L,D-transpeptidase family protein [Rhodospirillales bacterium]